MIDVRVEVRLRSDLILLSGPIRNPAALAALEDTVQERENFTVHDDAENAVIADQALAIGRREGTAQTIVWGEGRYRVELAPLPRAAGTLKVVGGFPLLDAAPPREPHGPTPEDLVEWRPPLVAVCDVHGLDGGRAELGRRFLSPQPRPASWLDRLAAWLRGVPFPRKHRKAVRP